ncbi:hypothetical protein ACSBR1_034422 [Camellia fascicularis]
MGHHFQVQVQVACHLQGRSLRGLMAGTFFVIAFFVLHVYQAKGLFYVELVLFFL